MNPITQFFGAAAIAVASSTTTQANDSFTEQEEQLRYIQLNCEYANTVGTLFACDFAILDAREPVEAFLDHPVSGASINRAEQNIEECQTAPTLYEQFVVNLVERLKSEGYEEFSNHASVVQEDIDAYLAYVEALKTCADETYNQLGVFTDQSLKDAYEDYSASLGVAINALELNALELN